jgi:DNA-binding transcriptional regulator YiaG
MYLHTNLVRLAINRAGGPTKISNLINVSNGTVHNWIKNQRVPNIDHARKLAEIAKMKIEQVRPV